ncbi:MAG TPA: molybdate ABC transporter substrate-binding protein [Pararhizobium sp.]|nr:molybdate ABC transporter substrate-binding protein [Pararhizobium sp.]
MFRGRESRTFFTAIVAVALAAVFGTGTLPARAQSSETVVFAAASLKNALDNIAAAYKKETGRTVRISYAGSSSLARQIEQKAPADIFISADTDWMDYLQKKGLIETKTRFNLLGNHIVLVAPKTSPLKSVDIKPGFDLAKLLGGGHLAMANTKAVPAGRYGKASLESLGVWKSVSDRIAQAENVRAALLLVARGEAPLGIVYSTDAVAEPEVKVLGQFPDKSHPPIIYPAALVKGANPEAARFLAYLKTATARKLFEEQGFSVLLNPSVN